GFRGQCIAEAVDRFAERVQLEAERREVGRRGAGLLQLRFHRIRVALPKARKSLTVHDVVRCDRFDRKRRLLELSRNQRCKIPERRNEAVQRQLVQAPLETIAEQRGERLSLANAVEQSRRFADAAGSEIDREGSASLRGVRAKMRIAKE